MDRSFEALLEAYGPQGWWPTRSPPGGEAARVEIAFGAILVQHTAWRNAERAVGALLEAGALSIGALHATDAAEVERLVRPAGTPSVKARRLKALARFVVDRHGGSLEALLAGVDHRPTALARRAELLTVHGVGPETADAILLYAGGAPLFVVDAYARRILRRHGWGDPKASYGAVQQFFEERLPPDPAAYNEMHALLVRVAVERCRSGRPDCSGCPLEGLLPPGGPAGE